MSEALFAASICPAALPEIVVISAFLDTIDGLQREEHEA